ncbi:MAG: SixA phosphatase family protein [Alphaproteobacteria bacterium]
MRRLLLLRHAKSDRDAGERDDHLRPLNERGRDAAALIGRYMREKKYLPALVLCSSARRTRETWDIVRRSLNGKAEVRFESALYLAEWKKMLDCVRRETDASPLLLIGHNPGMEQLAAVLQAPAKTPKHRKRAEAMVRKFSSGALAVFDFRMRGWASIGPGAGQLKDFVRPRELAKAKG